MEPETIFICPQPYRWHLIYEALRNAWEDNSNQSAPPPMPLILGGWWATGDLDKKLRWAETLRWAEVNGLTHLIPELSKDERYNVAELHGPVRYAWGNQRHAPKGVPSSEAVAAAMSLLCERWDEVASGELAEHTRPQAFTGRKRRRLLVASDPRFCPPWGSWHHLAAGNERRAFTQFRQRVNKAIHPLEVDDISFRLEPGGWPRY